MSKKCEYCGAVVCDGRAVPHRDDCPAIMTMDKLVFEYETYKQIVEGTSKPTPYFSHLSKEMKVRNETLYPLK